MGSLGTAAGNTGRQQAEREINISAGSPLVMGSLNKDLIRRVFQQQRPKFKYCYEKALLRDPQLSGKLVLRVVIGGDGKVTTVEIDRGSTLGSEEVSSCVLAAAKTMRFPTPAGGGQVIVKYPFLFRPRGT